jgi:hypothetical protein
MAAQIFAAALGPVKVIQLADGSWAVATVDHHGNVEMNHGKPNILIGTRMAAAAPTPLRWSSCRTSRRCRAQTSL